MAEYIERGALLEKAMNGIVAAIDVLYAPAADVAPVVHGEWINLTECANEGVYCSVCHKKVYRADYAWCVKKNKVRSNFCPNCGADMRERKGDGNVGV